MSRRRLRGLVAVVGTSKCDAEDDERVCVDLVVVVVATGGGGGATRAEGGKSQSGRSARDSADISDSVGPY